MRQKIGIIVDDQRSAIKAMLDALKNVEFVKIVKCFQVEREALAYIRNNHVDFVLLDMEMEKMNGFQFIASCPRSNMRFIIFSAHASYEDAVYDRSLTDFLLKPVSESRVRAALRRVNNELRDHNPLGIPLLEDAEESFMIKGPVRYQRRLIHLKNLIYIENRNKKLYFHIVGYTEPWISSDTFEEVLELLPQRWFLQCHQSFIFGKAFFETYVNGTVLLRPNGTEIPVGTLGLFPDFEDFLNTNVLGGSMP